MSRDQRWTGGTMNREWVRGSSVLPVTVNQPRLTGDVRRYLADCTAAHRAGIRLDPDYHPTVKGALKAIYHRHAEEAEFIAAVFEHLTGTVIAGA